MLEPGQSDAARGRPTRSEEELCVVAPDGKVQTPTELLSRWLELPVREIVGKEFVDLFPEWRDVLLALLGRARRGHEIQAPGMRIRLAGRSLWWSGRFSPVDTGEGIGVRVTSRDSEPAVGHGLPQSASADRSVERADEGRFRSFIEVSPEMTWLLNSKGESMVVSPAWVEFTGQTVEEASGLGHMDTAHPEDRPRLLAAWKEARARRGYYEVEYRLRRRDGVYRVVISRGMPTVKDTKGYCNYVGTVTDITERREAERAAREAAIETARGRAQLTAVFQALSDGVFVLAMDGRLVFVNDAEAKRLGLRNSEELLQRAAFFASKLAREGSWQETPFATFELRNPDGTLLPRDAWPHVRVLRGESDTDRELVVKHFATGKTRRVAFSSAPIRDGQGQQIMGLLVARDVTEEREAEEKLRESEERFRSLAESMIELAWVADEAGRLTWANRRFAEFSGSSSEDPIERVVECTQRLDGATEVVKEWQRHVADGEPWAGSFKLRGADGKVRWFMFRATPTRDGRGKVIRWFGTATDVTERRRVEEELRDVDRRKTEFLGVLSHELRNPLAPIRNSMFLLGRVPIDSPAGRRALEMIDRQTGQLARMVDDLLDVTRLSRGKVELTRERVDLREILGAVCDDHRARFVDGGIELRVALPVMALWMDADRSRIAQAMGKLLQNSAKYTKRGGRVEVCATAEKDRAVVAIRDDGIGIEGEELPRLFTPFTQVRQTLARTQGGLGLGLVVARGLVELHRGTVRVSSGGLGKGAEFVVELPLAVPVQPATEAERPIESGEAAGSKGHYILVVEDNYDAGESLAEVLQLCGHQVKVARDGQSGLALARETRPEVIICDVGLPDIDGYQVARELRGDERFRATRLIALTGYAQPEDRRRALAAGFDAHFAKPPPLDELQGFIASS